MESFTLCNFRRKTLSSAENTRIAVKNLSADRKKSRLVSNQNFCMKSMPRDIA